MRAELLAVLGIFILTGCTATAPTPVAEPKPIQQPSNLDEIAGLCSSQCQVDKETYCLEDQELILPSGHTTSGPCRSIAKYNDGFTQCQGFCKEYGNEAGCTLPDGTLDIDCNGI